MISKVNFRYTLLFFDFEQMGMICNLRGSVMEIQISIGTKNNIYFKIFFISTAIIAHSIMIIYVL